MTFYAVRANKERQREWKRAREREMLPRSLLTWFQWISMGEHESVIRIVVVALTLSGCCLFNGNPIGCSAGKDTVS